MINKAKLKMLGEATYKGLQASGWFLPLLKKLLNYIKFKILNHLTPFNSLCRARIPRHLPHLAKVVFPFCQLTEQGSGWNLREKFSLSSTS